MRCFTAVFRSRLTAIIVFAGAAGASGCESLLGIERAYAQPEATSPADASPIGDGAVRADSEAPGGPFCSAPGRISTFCADFDTDVNPARGWTFHAEAGYPGAGLFELNETEFRSAPASLRIGVPAGQPNALDGFVHRLAWEPPGTSGTTSVHVEVDLRLDLVDPTERAYLVALAFGATEQVYFVDLAATRAAAFLREQTPSEDVTTPLPRSLPQKTWTNVSFDFDFVASQMVVRIDGEVAVTRALAKGAVAGFRQLSVGMRYYTDSPIVASEALFDNVAVDLR